MAPKPIGVMGPPQPVLHGSAGKCHLESCKIQDGSVQISQDPMRWRPGDQVGGATRTPASVLWIAKAQWCTLWEPLTCCLPTSWDCSPPLALHKSCVLPRMRHFPLCLLALSQCWTTFDTKLLACKLVHLWVFLICVQWCMESVYRSCPMPTSCCCQWLNPVPSPWIPLLRILRAPDAHEFF